MKNVPKDAQLRRVRELTIEQLHQLKAADLKRLTGFAERRLGRLPRSRISAEDAVQKALHSILRGIHKGISGRRPKMEQVLTKGVFLHYVRSVINSVIAGVWRNPELLFIHESIHNTKGAERNQTTVVLVARPGPDADAGLVDLKFELFQRLRRIAPPKLLASIDEWEETFFWANQVPYRGGRDNSRQVRELAVRVLKVIAQDLNR